MTAGPRFRTGVGLTAAMLVALMIVALGARRIWTVDYWWQWKTGEYISEQGIPQTAFNSYTNPDHPRLELRWAYCLGLYKTSQWLGRESAVVLKILCLLATFALVASISARRGNLLRVGWVVAVGALAASQRFFVRPEVASYLLLAVFLALIERARLQRTRWVWLLPLVQVIWVNTHTFFLIGPAVVGIWLFAELLGLGLDRDADADRLRRLRTAGILLATTLLATLVNPYLHRAVLVPLIQFQALHGTGMKGFYSELYSPFSMPQAFTALSYYKLLIVLAAVAILLNLKRGRRSLPASAISHLSRDGFWLALLAVFFYLSAVSVRNVPMFCLVAIPYVIRGLSDTQIGKRDWPARLAPASRVVGLVLLAAFCIYQSFQLYTNRFNLRQGDSNQFGIGLARQRYPVEGTEFLKRAGVDGPIFNSSEAGSYLMAHDFEVYIDPRGEVYQERMIDEYVGIVRNPETVPGYLAQYGFRVFFLESDMFGLIAYLHGHPDFRIVYADAVTTILFRGDTAGHLPAIDLDDPDWLAGARRQLNAARPYASQPWNARLSSPKPHGKLARLCLSLQAYGSARALLEDSLAIYPAGFDGYEPLAHAAAALGDYDAAARYYDQAILRSPDRNDLRLQRAYAQHKGGDFESALATLDAFFVQDPNNAEALALCGDVALKQGRTEEAADWLERAISAEPETSRYHYYHAQVMFALQQYDRAEQSLETTFRLDPTSIPAAVGLAELNAGLGRIEAARSWAERAARIAPGDPQIQDLRRRLAEP